METVGILPVGEKEKEEERPLTSPGVRQSALAKMEKGIEALSVEDIVRILMESAFYFDLDLRERHSLIKHITEISSCRPEARSDFIKWI
jgi:hypothetical protein